MDRRLRKPNIALASKLNVAAWIVSAVVLSLVVLMRRVKIDVGMNFHFLPPFHALLNAMTAVTLIVALYFIKTKQIERHRRAIYTAMVFSIVFLLSYVVYHFTTPETKFGGEGTIRTVYFVLLLTHITLAALTLPFILLTFIRAYTNQFDKHKKMARWVYPFWLYVALTGPICYYMLMPYYK